jgi:Domain of unknown function (DUF1992)
MTARWESAIDKQIREAQERGDFDNLPGTGKPLPDLNQPYDENWWVKGLLKRENEASPSALLALRKEIESLPERLQKLTLESSVKEIVTDLNKRIRKVATEEDATLTTVDVEKALAAWREHRAATKQRR